jgi:phage tail sheath protein FI
LFISKSIVEAHGGKMWAENNSVGRTIQGVNTSTTAFIGLAKNIPTNNDIDSEFESILNPNTALFFPRIKATDPLDENNNSTLHSFVPSGAIAGVIARTDSDRGVWKAPAGIKATLVGVSDLTVLLTDEENGDLNLRGVNCLRIFSGDGVVVWGSRTMARTDQGGRESLADQWKYLSVRRTALFIEESLYRGTRWAVFEPNDESLWSQLRLTVSGFMNNLYSKGAFQGSCPVEAYFVKCDNKTTTQEDIDKGMVNIVIGFAPLIPAEFVILKIRQLAGQKNK